ncbi:MAG: NfeD family protein, partial [Pseudomonadota bacterium]
FPLVWYFFTRNKRSVTGVSGMLGETVKVKTWEKANGQVYFNGELWKAMCDTPLAPGNEAIIEKVEGLTLHLKPPEQNSNDFKSFHTNY